MFRKKQISWEDYKALPWWRKELRALHQWFLRRFVHKVYYTHREFFTHTHFWLLHIGRCNGGWIQLTVCGWTFNFHW